MYTGGVGLVLNVCGSVYWEGSVCRGCKFYYLIIEIDQSETAKSYMFIMSFQLTNYKCLTAKSLQG